MNIIKKGCLQEFVTFECDVCGCIFEATIDEYDVERNRDGAKNYKCNCPCCKYYTLALFPEGGKNN